MPCNDLHIRIAPAARKVPHLSHIPPPFFADVTNSDIAPGKGAKGSDVLVCTVSIVVHPVALTLLA